MVMMSIDEPAQAQRKAALANANRIRFRRAEAKREVKSGELELAALIEDPPEWLLSAEIGEVVQWEPGVGRWRASRILNGLAAGTKRLDLLGDATRRRVAERLRETSPRWAA